MELGVGRVGVVISFHVAEVHGFLVVDFRDLALDPFMSHQYTPVKQLKDTTIHGTGIGLPPPNRPPEINRGGRVCNIIQSQMSGVKNHPELLLRLYITTFRQSLRNAFAAACFAFADPLRPTTSLANPFAEFLLLTSKKSISKGESFLICNLHLLLTSKKSISKGESFLICNHCFRHIFANLSPTFRLVIRNLWMTCFVLKTSSPTLSQQNPFIKKKSEPFSKPFAKLSPTAVFLSHRFIILSPT